MTLYSRRPLVVNAIQFTGTNHEAIETFFTDLGYELDTIGLRFVNTGHPDHDNDNLDDYLELVERGQIQLDDNEDFKPTPVCLLSAGGEQPICLFCTSEDHEADPETWIVIRSDDTDPAVEIMSNTAFTREFEEKS